ncbi:hypothetical protein pdam_00024427, partial [Pocillopora damicornis]
MREIESQLAGGKPVGYLQSVQELSSGPPKTNPSSGRKEDPNPGPPACKSSALTTRPRSPPPKLNRSLCRRIYKYLPLYCVLSLYL